MCFVCVGNNYMTADTLKKISPTEDWSLCGDGVTVKPEAVKGAVDDFAVMNNLKIYTTHEINYKSWIYSRKSTHVFNFTSTAITKEKVTEAAVSID